MHQALPYKTWHAMPTTFPKPVPLNNFTSSSNTTIQNTRDYMTCIVDENAVVVFGIRGCCMSHVVRRLLLGLGVNPAVHEVDEQDEQSIINELEQLGPTGRNNGCRISFPTVFIGGRWFGGLDKVMATHITGELTPILKEAGALWL